MDFVSLIIACLVSFVVSIFSVAVGGTSLITVPVFISLGMTSKSAVATNMFALIFLSVSGFWGLQKAAKPVRYNLFTIFSVLTVCGSIIGARFLLAVDSGLLRKMIAVMIGIMAGLFFIKKDLGLREAIEKISKKKLIVGSLIVFILGIYGGFFSGGYVTVLTYVLVVVFSMDFLQAAFTTKFLNIFSSSVACLLFFVNDLIDFYVGIPLAVSMSAGALLGAKIAVKMGNIWLRNLFVFVVLLLAVKMLFFD
jgi:uncharacterized membrane protein YfcA